ncbi:hypothetical protein DPMN_103046 [Dreissena polymorpha]|uniref:Uncharacterized protein n=1 Tax=Dreissena polymorpha TaxID=45954 RepID=A0A9D4HDQ6_DREPO|nr:hypothetical protein DPMN_103046 [Dreissena polymorpha]
MNDIVMARTSSFMAIFDLRPLNSKCDLDLGDIDVIISRDTPSNDGEQMCQMILKSDNERHSYGPDKLVPPARQPASPPASQPARPHSPI